MFRVLKYMLLSSTMLIKKKEALICTKNEYKLKLFRVLQNSWVDTFYIFQNKGRIHISTQLSIMLCLEGINDLTEKLNII